MAMGLTPQEAQRLGMAWPPTSGWIEARTRRVPVVMRVADSHRTRMADALAAASTAAKSLAVPKQTRCRWRCRLPLLCILVLDEKLHTSLPSRQVTHRSSLLFSDRRSSTGERKRLTCAEWVEAVRSPCRASRRTCSSQPGQGRRCLLSRDSASQGGPGAEYSVLREHRLFPQQ